MERLRQLRPIWEAEAVNADCALWTIIGLPTFIVTTPLVIWLGIILPPDGSFAMWCPWGVLFLMSVLGFLAVLVSIGFASTDWVRWVRPVYQRVIAHHSWEVDVVACDGGATVRVTTMRGAKERSLSPKQMRYIRHREIVPQGEDFGGRIVMAQYRAEQICATANALGEGIRRKRRDATRAADANRDEVSLTLEAIAEIEASELW